MITIDSFCTNMAVAKVKLPCLYYAKCGNKLIKQNKNLYDISIIFQDDTFEGWFFDKKIKVERGFLKNSDDSYAFNMYYLVDQIVCLKINQPSINIDFFKDRIEDINTKKPHNYANGWHRNRNKEGLRVGYYLNNLDIELAKICGESEEFVNKIQIYHDNFLKKSELEQEKELKEKQEKEEAKAKIKADLLGFADNKTDLQTHKIHKFLTEEILKDGEKFMSRKDFMLKLHKLGYSPRFFENQKQKYFMLNEKGKGYQVTKTEYYFINFILSS